MLLVRIPAGWNHISGKLLSLNRGHLVFSQSKARACFWQQSILNVILQEDEVKAMELKLRALDPTYCKITEYLRKKLTFLGRDLPRATAGVEQNNPMFTPGVAKRDFSLATAMSQLATS